MSGLVGWVLAARKPTCGFRSTLPTLQNKIDNVVANIQQIHTELSTQVSKAVNVSLTLRNWLIGMYIHEYELNGSDRAAYFDTLLENLANNLKGLSNCNKRQLYRYHQFYELYPQIVEAVPAQFKNLLPANAITQKVGTASPHTAKQLNRYQPWKNNTKRLMSGIISTKIN